MINPQFSLHRLPQAMHCFPVSPTLTPWTSWRYLIKAGHRLICTSNLNLKESSFLSPAAFFGALDLRLVCIVPSPRPAEHVFPLFSREGLPLEVLSFDNELVGAGLAFKAVGRSVVGGGDGGSRDCEHVRARGADWNI
jgi:hypothetical protein